MFKDKEEKLYSLFNIDHFSKYAYNYIIKKDENAILNKVKVFIQKNGISEKIIIEKNS